ncbi:MAG: hypothetical protein FWD67_11755, partial [Betaproteobacteria bacterium]|nr:hypothetical protein [Betaproteobacteria bacterium]
TMLYRSTHCLCRRGAAVEYLSHNASFHSVEEIVPSNAGTKQLGTTFAVHDETARHMLGATPVIHGRETQNLPELRPC